MSIFKLENNDDFNVKKIIDNNFDQTPGGVNTGTIFIVKSGKCEIIINIRSYLIKKNMIFLILPGDKIEFTNVSDDFSATILVMSGNLLGESVSRFEHYVMEAFFKGRLIPMIPNSESMRFFLNVVENVEITYREKNNFYRYEQALSLLRSLMCYAADFIRQNSDKAEQPNFNRLEEHFRNFMNTLTTNYKASREVSYYAERMHLTPKYLNFISNSVANRTCKSMIDNYVIMQLKTELRSTQKTIQEIAYEYNFANQSFLGSYFKKFTGMSPRKFRSGDEIEIVKSSDK